MYVCDENVSSQTPRNVNKKPFSRHQTRDIAGVIHVLQ